ncbi:hypothetical protein KUCAC02_032641, partial [Chaenocephalus aceratus]
KSPNQSLEGVAVALLTVTSDNGTNRLHELQAGAWPAPGQQTMTTELEVLPVESGTLETGLDEGDAVLQPQWISALHGMSMLRSSMSVLQPQWISALQWDEHAALLDECSPAAVDQCPSWDEHAALLDECSPAAVDQCPSWDEHAALLDECSPAAVDQCPSWGEYAALLDECSPAVGDLGKSTAPITVTQ